MNQIMFTSKTKLLLHCGVSSPYAKIKKHYSGSYWASSLYTVKSRSTTKQTTTKIKAKKKETSEYIVIKKTWVEVTTF